jgi:GTP-binding protein
VDEWPKFINPYLETRASLALCVCLVDANIPPQKSDAQLIDWLRHVDRPFLVVATKSDRVGSRLQSSLNTIKQELQVEEILPFSSKTGTGRDALWKKLRDAGDQKVSSEE